jgi:hypothetical protein
VIVGGQDLPDGQARQQQRQRAGQWWWSELQGVPHIGSLPRLRAFLHRECGRS